MHGWKNTRLVLSNSKEKQYLYLEHDRLCASWTDVSSHMKNRFQAIHLVKEGKGNTGSWILSHKYIYDILRMSLRIINRSVYTGWEAVQLSCHGNISVYLGLCPWTFAVPLYPVLW